MVAMSPEGSFKQRTDPPNTAGKDRPSHSIPNDYAVYVAPTVYLPYAWVCLSAVVAHSQEAEAAYQEIVSAWGESAAEQFMDALAERPEGLLSAGSSTTTYPEARPMRNMIGGFMEKHFNRPTNKPKINRERSRFLGRIIALRSLSDWAGIPPEAYTSYPTDELQRVMKGDWPTDGPGRELRSEVSNTMRGLGAHLLHTDKLTTGAELWHLTRVSPGSIPRTLMRMHEGDVPDAVPVLTDETDLRQRIRLYDIATGRLSGCP